MRGGRREKGRRVSENGHAWWEEAVVYEVYPRSFADADGNGVGDLPGLRSRLPYLADLGVDAIWLTPFYPSPLVDGGYDVSDYRAVDPLLGTLADFDALIKDGEAHQTRVIVDLVPNHCSSAHPLFQAALAAAPGSRERARFIFRDGRGPRRRTAAEQLEVVFGGLAWTRVTEADGRPGQWYLHLFDTGQPDWNWRNPDVPALFEQVIRFWLDRGAAGLRVDVAHGIFKDPDLPDDPDPDHLYQPGERALGLPPPARAAAALPVLAGHPGLLPGGRVPRSADRGRRGLGRHAGHPAALPGVRRPASGLQLRADRGQLGRGRVPPRDRRGARAGRRLARAMGHRQPRRAPAGEPLPARRGLRPADDQPAREPGPRPPRDRRPPGPGRGPAAARAARDPPTSTRARSWACPRSRTCPPPRGRTRGSAAPTAGCSAATAAAYRCPGPGPARISASPRPPRPRRPGSPSRPDWGGYSVEAQLGDPDSFLSLYRAALRLRRDHPALGRGTLRWLDGPHDADGLLCFAREPGFVFAANLGRAVARSRRTARSCWPANRTRSAPTGACDPTPRCGCPPDATPRRVNGSQ